MRLQPLRNAYSQADLMSELRSTVATLTRADRQETVVYPDRYDIAVADSSLQPGRISQKLPLMFGPVVVDAQVDRGFWKNSFLVVIRPNDHQIIIRQGNYSKGPIPVTLAEVEEVVIPAGQMSPQYTRFRQGPLQSIGIHWGYEPLAEIHSTAEERSQAQQRVADMISAAQQLVAQGSRQAWGFLQYPTASSGSEPLQTAY